MEERERELLLHICIVDFLYCENTKVLIFYVSRSVLRTEKKDKKNSKSPLKDSLDIKKTKNGKKSEAKHDTDSHRQIYTKRILDREEEEKKKFLFLFFDYWVVGFFFSFHFFFFSVW